MGSCVGSQPQKKRKEALPKNYKVGLLEVRIIRFHPNDQILREAKLENLIVKIRVSNQIIKSPLHEVLDQFKHKQTLKFFINSTKKIYGRNITFQIWNNIKVSQSYIPLGIMDVNKIIQQCSSSGQENNGNHLITEVHLDNLDKQGGKITVDFKYTPMEYKTIKLNIGEVEMKKKNKATDKTDKKPKRYSLKIIIGEQNYETDPTPIQDDIVKFNTETIDFMVPSALKEGSVRFIQKEEKTGTDYSISSCKIDLSNLVQSEKNISIRSEMQAQSKDVSCSLKYMPVSDEISSQSQLIQEPTKSHFRKSIEINRVGRPVKRIETSLKCIEEQDEEIMSPMKKRKRKLEDKSTNDIEIKENFLNCTNKIPEIPEKKFQGIMLARVEKSEETETSKAQTQREKETEKEKNRQKMNEKRRRIRERKNSMNPAPCPSLPSSAILNAMKNISATNNVTKHLY